MSALSLLYIKSLKYLKTPASATIGTIFLCDALIYICKYVYGYYGCDWFYIRGSYVCQFAKSNEIKLQKRRDDSIQFVLDLIANLVEQILSMPEKI